MKGKYEKMWKAGEVKTGKCKKQRRISKERRIKKKAKKGSKGTMY